MLESWTHDFLINFDLVFPILPTSTFRQSSLLVHSSFIHELQMCMVLRHRRHHSSCLPSLLPYSPRPCLYHQIFIFLLLLFLPVPPSIPASLLLAPAPAVGCCDGPRGRMRTRPGGAASTSTFCPSPATLSSLPLISSLTLKPETHTLLAGMVPSQHQLG